MATFIKSPNYTPGRQGKAVKYVVIHWMAGTLAGTDARFKSDAADVSAHYGIENSNVHQYVKEIDTAWHAGNWDANLQSIGIEHSAAPGRTATAQTYATSISLIADICKRYKLNPDTAIVPHKKFFNTACPGTMDLNKIKAGVKAKLAVSSQANAAQVTKAYKEILERNPDKGGLKHYTTNGMNEAQVRADLMKSGERKKLEARKKAEADARAKAEAAKKAETAKAEAAAKKAAEEAAKKAQEHDKAIQDQKDKFAEENNNLLKQILALLQSFINKFK